MSHPNLQCVCQLQQSGRVVLELCVWRLMLSVCWNDSSPTWKRVCDLWMWTGAGCQLCCYQEDLRGKYAAKCPFGCEARASPCTTQAPCGRWFAPLASCRSSALVCCFSLLSQTWFCQINTLKLKKMTWTCLLPVLEPWKWGQHWWLNKHCSLFLPNSGFTTISKWATERPVSWVNSD